MKKIPKEMKIMKFKIFLSVFGLTLDNYEDIDNISTINILKDNEKVGELNIDNDQESIIAHFDNNNSLYASFSNYLWEDSWYDEDIKNYFCDLTIKFQFMKGFHTNLNGDIAFHDNISSEGKNTCRVNSYLKGTLKNNSRIELDIKKLHDLSSELIIGNTRERLTINPYPYDDEYDDDTNYSFLHLYKKYNNNDDNSNPYLYYSILNNYTDNGKKVVDIFEQKGKEIIANNKESLLFEELSPIPLLNDINNMNKIDPGIKNSMKNLKEALTMENINLFDNLISLCYEYYNDKTLEDIFGIKKKKISDTIPYSCIEEALFKDIDYNDLFTKEKQLEYKKDK